MQVGLRFGGNDVGSILIEENVVFAAGVTRRTSERELRRIIRDAGFRPVKRDTLYRTYFLDDGSLDEPEPPLPNAVPSPRSELTVWTTS